MAAIMKTEWVLLSSSGSLEGILDAIARFYCGERKRIENGQIIGGRGVIEGVRVIQKRGRYRFEMLMSVK